MKIGEIRNPELFQRLVQRLFAAERGADFQIPDDSGGDRGNDGYDSARGILYSIYCPEKPDTADFRRKARSDLEKVVRLAKSPGYKITSWVFVTPSALRERLQSEIRLQAQSHGLVASFLADLHLEDLFRRYPHLRDEFPELEYPEVSRQLEEIRSLLEQMQTPTQPVEAIAQTESSVQQPSSTMTGVLVGLISPRLYAIYVAAEKGDPGALAALERYRMEALDTRDYLDAVLLELQIVAESNQHLRALRTAEAGLGRARSAQMRAETAVLSANVAFYKALELTRLEMDHEANLQFTRISGFPFQSIEQIENAERPIVELQKEIEALLTEARTAAMESNNLLAIHIAMIRQGMTLTQRRWAAALRVQVGGDKAAAAFLDRIKGQMERSYEASIRAARAMNDEERLATAYGNLANDLHTFGDDARAREHALHALELAKRSGYQIQVEKTSLLLSKLPVPLNSKKD